jgi:hypothetical protein
MSNTKRYINNDKISGLDAFIESAPEITTFNDKKGDDQQYLGLIPHKVGVNTVMQRVVDGYANATAMCQAVSKRFSNYAELRATREYLDILSSDIGISPNN